MAWNGRPLRRVRNVDDYFAILKAIRDDARKRPPVRKVIGKTVTALGSRFAVHDETNEPRG